MKHKLVHATGIFLKWVSTTLLTPAQRNFIKSRLNERQVLLVSKLMHNADKNQRYIENLRTKLLTLGFVERAYAELFDLSRDESRPKLRKLAAWELAQWHANQYNQEDARMALEMLRIVKAHSTGKEDIRQTAIMEAECLDLLGELVQAVKIIESVMTNDSHPDLFLARANLATSMPEKIRWFNEALKTKRIAPLKISDHGYSLDDLTPQLMKPYKITAANQPKVTVIIPVYNAEQVIRTAMDSVLAQTWTNLEVIVVDDCSTDATAEIIKEYMAIDDRIQYLKTMNNGGPYVARNLALQVASGEFVTCHDADDWSHPQKIEIQVTHLLKNRKAIANTSEQVRATSDLRFYRRGKPGAYIFQNMSSLMFRREIVMNKLGYWDSVRFGADSEFLRRIRKLFGEHTVVDLPTGPLSIQRQTEHSLTGNAFFGYHGYFMGARKEYFESYQAHHQQTIDLKYDFPQHKRPFPVPEPMWPEREKKTNDRRHFDVVIVSDFRLLGGSTLSSAEEIKAQLRGGLKTGLIQLNRYDYDANRKINKKIRDLVDGDKVQFVVYGEKISCDVLIIRYPPVLQEKQRFVPDVEARDVRIIVNQTPYSHYGEGGEIRFDILRCQQRVRELFGKEGVWHPIGPLVRNALLQYHADELSSIHLSDQDWHNIINIDEWRRKERPQKSSVIKIGRHSRGDAVKWPSNKDVLLSVYPDSSEFEIRVLGGADVPRKILGKLPSNWRVYAFNELDPKEFLAELDVFVYFTHEHWVESFGRVILEAMAAGVPVILSPHYRQLFGDAAIYAEPSQVVQEIRALMSNEEYYQQKVTLAQQYVEREFGYGKHLSRIEAIRGGMKIAEN